MHKVTLLLAMLFMMNKTGTTAQSPPELTGRLNIEQLQSEPLKTWFVKPANPVVPDSGLLKDDYSRHKALLVLGTWCEDSHRYVPEILDYLSRLPGFNHIQIFAVGRDKHCPECPPGVNPERIPLLVLYRNQTELGRLVEQPPVTVKAFLDATLRQP